MVNGSGYCFPLSISLFLCCCYHKRVQHRTDTVINLNWNGNLHSGYVHETSSIIMWHYHWYSEKVGGWFSSIVINNLVRKTSKIAISLTKDFNYRVRHHLYYFDRVSYPFYFSTWYVFGTKFRLLFGSVYVGGCHSPLLFPGFFSSHQNLFSRFLCFTTPIDCDFRLASVHVCAPSRVEL